MRWILCAVGLMACALSGGPQSGERPPMPLDASCLAALDAAMPLIDEAPGDITDAEEALNAQQECQAVLGSSSRVCDIDQIMSRDAFLCAAIHAGVDEGVSGWRLNIVFLERLGRICWVVQRGFEDGSHRNYKFDATTGDLLDVTMSSSIP